MARHLKESLLQRPGGRRLHRVIQAESELLLYWPLRGGVLDSPSSSKSKEDFHVAMQLAAETGDLEHIAELVDEMADKGIQPKEDTYSLIFKVCQHSLDSKTKTFAERYFLAMISIGIEPQESTLSLMDKVVGEPRRSELWQTFKKTENKAIAIWLEAIAIGRFCGREYEYPVPVGS
eukprot:g13638.t1